jgi:PAS domain
MVESIGSGSSRWMTMKREEFVNLEEAHRGTKQMPRCIERQESRFQHAMSSLSSSSDNLNNSASSGDDSAAATRHNKKIKESVANPHTTSGPMDLSMAKPPAKDAMDQANGIADVESSVGAHKVSSSSGSGSGSGSGSDSGNKNANSNDFHDYHAKPMPDPKLEDSEQGNSSPSEDSPGEESNAMSDGGNKSGSQLPISTDSSSGDDCSDPRRSVKRRKSDSKPSHHIISESGKRNDSESEFSSKSAKIAKKGGIPHNIHSVDAVPNGIARLQHVAPAIALPPFAGIGKRPDPTTIENANLTASLVASLKAGDDSCESLASAVITRKPVPGHGTLTRRSLKKSDASSKNGPAIIYADLESSTQDSGDKQPAITAHYHINEDDMILMDDVVMCPYIFRSQEAVTAGAFAECAMPGMLRAQFSARNKLMSIELVYDAMGFMQQLERASGNEGAAHIIPGSLEMALAPTLDEARVITLAQPPFLIVNVNEVWTRITGYTQMEVEGREYLTLLEGLGTVSAAKDRPNRPHHRLEKVAKGKPACSTNIHYDKDGKDFIEFVCSYPLMNASDEITHLLHVSQELPSYAQHFQRSTHNSNAIVANGLLLTAEMIMQQQYELSPIEIKQENA